jgi:hypothetical protein
MLGHGGRMAMEDERVLTEALADPLLSWRPSQRTS